MQAQNIRRYGCHQRVRGTTEVAERYAIHRLLMPPNEIRRGVTFSNGLWSYLHQVGAEVQFLCHSLKLRAQHTILVADCVPCISSAMDHVLACLAQLPGAREDWSDDGHLCNCQNPKAVVVHYARQRNI